MDDALSARAKVKLSGWKEMATHNAAEGYFSLKSEAMNDVEARLFLTPKLFEELEDNIYPQIINAANFHGTKLVVITPDAHYGYGVPVGCVILTDAKEGAIAMGPVGYDIGCFTGETLVSLSDGNSYRMVDLASRLTPFCIFAINDQQKIVIAEATASKTRVNAQLVRVNIDNGKHITCTPDHLFMLRDGSYLQAEQLKPETSLMPFYHSLDENRQTLVVQPQQLLEVAHANNHKVTSVQTLAYTEDVYCLTVPLHHNFALDAGVFVHNCGMVSASSEVEANKATPAKRLEFNQEVMKRISMGAGKASLVGKNSNHPLSHLDKKEFEHIIREGADYYVSQYGNRVDRSQAERHCIPVDDSWSVPFGNEGRPERGIPQLGSLGGGNHFIELQRSAQTHKLFVQVHTGSRGFGHGLATNYFRLAKEEKPKEIRHLDMGFFTPESKYYTQYLNAVAAGANYAIVNRLAIFEQIAIAFRRVFGEDLHLIYEISHNLVQREWHPEFGEVNVHRKGATRAFPAGHPGLTGTPWETTGHPVLIPGSNQDFSYILRPLPGAEKSGFSVNHGAGRKMSRGEAKRRLSQGNVNREYKKAGIVVNTNGIVPLDESGGVYKSSREVVSAVTAAGLARIEHELIPLASLKATD